MAKPTKMYYSITEVANLAGLKPHILRYWETEFSILHPKKNRAGNRAYREKDIEIVKLIKTLLYSEGYTIEGAKRQIRKLRADGYKPGETPIEDLMEDEADVEAESVTDDFESKLREIREDLREILTLLGTRPK
ncbi:MAG TPA: MerR family transcriptional regulator [candidate division Zixibacteria bacterium]|nr:MerR family transcriptional regulator [candidate division Zixibacteria bacterium]